MGLRKLAFTRVDTCSVRGSALAVGAEAWWDNVARSVTCLDCGVSTGSTSVDPPALPAATAHPSGPPKFVAAPPVAAKIESGVAGGSAQHEHDRRQAKHEAQLDARWGRFASVAKFFAEEPQTTRAWAQGASGEARLAGHLGRSVGGYVEMLHDRKVPGTRGNIDHLIICSNGVWIVDAKAHKGKVERRDKGGWFKTDMRLFVGGRDQTKLAEGVGGWQRKAVLKALGEEQVAVHLALCFTDADWGLLFARPFEIHGVLCTWAQKLAEHIEQPGTLTVGDVDRITRMLADKLPPALHR